MRKNKFNKLVKENKENLQKVLYKHINDEIYLTSKQLDEILKKRGDYNGRDFKRANTARI